MAQYKYNLSVKLLLLIGLICLTSITLVNSKGGGGGGGGRGGGGSIGGRGTGSSRILGPTVRAAPSSGKKFGISKKTGGLIAAGGVASYAAYRVGRNSNKPGKGKDLEGDLLEIEDTNSPFKVQESKYRRREGLGMSALGIILLILGIIGFGTAVWCCYTIGIPFWKDKKSRRNRTMEFPHVITSKGDDIPLHETPSTATPSP